MKRRQLPLDNQFLVVGDMSCVLGALKQLGIPEILIDYYPVSLSNFMYRKTWISRIYQLERRLSKTVGTLILQLKQ
mgnify:CR=1 FL=1